MIEMIHLSDEINGLPTTFSLLNRELLMFKKKLLCLKNYYVAFNINTMN